MTLLANSMCAALVADHTGWRGYERNRVRGSGPTRAGEYRTGSGGLGIVGEFVEKSERAE
ncbi:hypothetical protein GCM10027089_33620 [Nocardia thraciensis]